MLVNDENATIYETEAITEKFDISHEPEVKMWYLLENKLYLEILHEYLLQIADKTAQMFRRYYIENWTTEHLNLYSYNLHDIKL